MQEFEVPPGVSISWACEKLAKRAPAFMVFNETRVEALPGDTAEDLHAQWARKGQLRK